MLASGTGAWGGSPALAESLDAQDFSELCCILFSGEKQAKPS